MEPYAGLMAVGLSGLATLISVLALRTSLRTRHAGLVLDFRREYDDPEMSRALRVLRYWRETSSDGGAARWARELHKGNKHLDVEPPTDVGPEDPRLIDWARRHVSSYFQRACQFLEQGFISCPDFQFLASSAGFELMREPVLELETALADQQKNNAASDEEKCRTDDRLASLERCVSKLEQAQVRDYCLLHGR